MGGEALAELSKDRKVLRKDEVVDAGLVLDLCGGDYYDPLFVPEGFAETFGELPVAIKNRLSHRAKALQKLRDWSGWKPTTD